MERRRLFDIDDAELEKSRSKMSRLAELMPEIEKLLGAGVSRQAVLTNLNQQGFGLSMSSFATMLKRLRKRGAKSTMPSKRPIHRIDGRDAEATRHARTVHDQFKDNEGRPRTVQHDLTKVPKW